VKFLSVSLGILLLFSCQQSFGARVGLLVVATGKYINFVEPLVRSAEKHFCKNHEVSYFIFTDGALPVIETLRDGAMIKVEHQRSGWPYDTLLRCVAYAQHQAVFESMDYLFACDADMLFVDTVGDEILSRLVATQHPGYVGRRGTYETNGISTACVRNHEGSCYFAGGFHGGERNAFLHLVLTMSKNIFKDLDKNFIAVWHDESHLNRYFIDNPPTLILNPSYCYPESWRLPYHKRLLALDKNHAEIRK
jgi:histo-blood group ABO system transferase